MAKPRIFISSTYYDLKSVRNDLDRFIKSLGYEPIRHESGHIAYGKDDKPEAFAYKEIEYSDILVCIVGGRYGTTSQDGTYSITQKELKTALDQGKQVYIFVEDSVYHEHNHYIANKDVSGVKYTAVDNVAVHKFLEEIYTLPKGNPIFKFSVSSDITSILSEQWAGLFQRLLIESSAKSQMALFDELQRSLQTVGQLVQFLTDQKEAESSAVQEILFANHPIFNALKELLRNPYRIYFTTFRELDIWLSSAKAFKLIEDVWADFPEEYYQWSRKIQRKLEEEEITLYVSKKVFKNDGDLKSMRPGEWNDNFIKSQRKTTKLEDDIPF